MPYKDAADFRKWYRRWYERNRERVMKKNRLWAHLHPERTREICRESLRRRRQRIKGNQKGEGR